MATRTAKGGGWELGFRRFVREVLGPGVFLSALVIVLIYFTSRPVYEAGSLIKVEPARSALSGGNATNRSFQTVLATQAELIRSPNVLSVALADPRIAKLPMFRGVVDLETALRQALNVQVVPNSYLIMVSMTSSTPDDCVIVVNEVVDVYLKQAAEWSHGLKKAQLKSLEDYQREIDAQAKEKQAALLAFVAKAEDPGDRSNLNGRVTPDRLQRFLADYDAAVAGRIKAEADLAAETARVARTESAKARRAERLDDLQVRLDAERAAEKALLDRVQSAEKTSATEQVKLQLLREELASLTPIRDNITRRMEQLRLEMQGQAQVSRVSEAKGNRLPIANPSARLMAMAPLAVFTPLIGIWWLRSRRGFRDELDD